MMNKGYLPYVLKATMVGMLRYKEITKNIRKHQILGVGMNSIEN